MTQHTDGERYRYLRTLTPAVYSSLWRRALRGDATFDSLVDEAINIRRESEDAACLHPRSP